MKRLICLVLLSFPMISNAYETAEADGISFTTAPGSRVTEARILRLQQTRVGYTYVFVDKTAQTSNTPECAYNTRRWNRWLIHHADLGAKSQISMLLAAAATGKLVRITGTAECSKDPSTEVISSVILDYGPVQQDQGPYSQPPPSSN